MRILARSTRAVLDEIDQEGSWAVSYGDLVTLLLTFFLLFFSIDNREVKQKQFKVLQTELMNRLETLKTNTSAGLPFQLDIGKTNGKNIEEKLALDMGAKITRQGERLVIEFPGVSFFDFSEKKIRSTAIKTLQKFTGSYMPFAGKFVLSIRAFTDATPVISKRKGYSDNLELSALRSISAMRVFQKSGIPLNRMRIAGVGEFSSRSLAGTPSHLRNPASRKIVLIIEPEIKDLI